MPAAIKFLYKSCLNERIGTCKSVKALTFVQLPLQPKLSRRR